MRDGWNRATETLALTLEHLTTLVQPTFPGQAVLEAQTAEGGLANTNLKLTLSGQSAPILLRLYTRRPEIAPLEAALSRLVLHHVPAARFLHLAEVNPITGHPYALLEWVDGVRLETAAFEMSAREVAQMGREVGRTLAGIHSFTFPVTSFLNAQLRVVQHVDVGGAGLRAFLEDCLLEGRGGERLGSSLTHELLAFVDAEGALLDTWDGLPCLTHSDFGGSNILMRHAGQGWRVAAVLDWEFAFSGSPFFDFGNLLRPPLGTVPRFEAAVAEGYREAGRQLPDAWKRMSLLADLTAWADFLNRPNTGAGLINDARAMIQRTLAVWSTT